MATTALTKTRSSGKGRADMAQRDLALISALSAMTESIKVGSAQTDARFSDLSANLDAKHTQNRTDVHKQGGQIDLCLNKLSLVEGRIQVAEDRLHTIIGTGDGGSGSLNEVRRSQTEMGHQLSEVISTVRIIEERTRDSGKDRDFRLGWKGVMIGLGVLGTLTGIAGFGITLLVIFYKIAVATHH